LLPRGRHQRVSDSVAIDGFERTPHRLRREIFSGWRNVELCRTILPASDFSRTHVPDKEYGDARGVCEMARTRIRTDERGASPEHRAVGEQLQRASRYARAISQFRGD